MQLSTQRLTVKTSQSIPKIPWMDLSRQTAKLRPQIERAIGELFERGDFILGSESKSFETEFAQYCDAKYCIGVANGTDALVLGLRALGVGPGDEVITSALSFFATAEAIALVGAKPVFADVDADTLTLDPEEIREKISERTRAIMPVHLYGNPCNIQVIERIAERHNLRIIHDACQAHGASYRGRRIGSFRDITAFSFYPSKNLGAFGDAGALVTDDPDIARRIRLLRDHGQEEKNQHLEIATNSRLDDIQAAILRIKLPHLDNWNSARIQLAGHYRELLSSADDLRLVTPCPDGIAVYHLFVVRLKNRDHVRERLAQQGIGTGVHYPTPLHLVPALSPLGHHRGEFPAAENAADTVVSLPMFPELTSQEVEYVVQHLTA